MLKDEVHANSMFEVTKMAAGSIQHFYEGLKDALVPAPSNYFIFT